MNKITIEIEDNLPEYKTDAKNELKENILDILKENNYSKDNLPEDLRELDNQINDFCLFDLIGEIANSYVSIYGGELRNCEYFHSDEITTAFKNGGFEYTDNWMRNAQMGICACIQEEMYEYMQNNLRNDLIIN